jgi:hypothetical protein
VKKLTIGLGVLGAGGAMAAALTLPPAFAGPSVHYTQEIYQVTVTAPEGRGPVSEWASLVGGTWRADVDDQTIISSDASYVVIDSESGSVYHRVGAPPFMGDLHEAPDGVLALRAYLEGDPALARRGLHLGVGKDSAGKTTLAALDSAGRTAFSVTIERRVSDEDAAAAHLLDVDPIRPQTTDTGVAVGRAPTNGVKAYWFGRAIGTLHAAAAAEHSRVRSEAQIAAGVTARADARVHVTFYERPGTDVTGAQPGLLQRPDGELQVSSEPVDSAHAQGLIAAFDGTNGDETYPVWPRSAVTLADGEQAVLVLDRFDGDGATRAGFYVITPTTLVFVSGEIAAAEVADLAAKLRPLE